ERGLAAVAVVAGRLAGVGGLVGGVHLHRGPGRGVVGGRLLDHAVEHLVAEVDDLLLRLAPGLLAVGLLLGAVGLIGGRLGVALLGVALLGVALLGVALLGAVTLLVGRLAGGLRRQVVERGGRRLA